ncbi:MAG: redoxin domain-containing protein [Chloroflexi bacterium]|nr:MAG: redoxin domain-containing protein [Chloroflexota bacterium]
MTQEMRSLYREMAITAIDGTPMTGEKMAVLRELMMRREELAPNVVDEAPDFNLPVLHGDGQRVSLSALRGQPVALFFGSYT